MSWGHILVDLDGTLAMHATGLPGSLIGQPIPAMVSRVRHWLSMGKDVRIFTSRVCVPEADRPSVEAIIQHWCQEHLGQVLPITNQKDFSTTEIYDDRAIQVVMNTGAIVSQ